MHALSRIVECLNISFVCISRLDEAVSTFERMQSQGIVPSSYSYGTMIHIHGKAFDYEAAAALFTEMREKGFAPDEVIYSTIINLYGKANLFDEAEQLFEELREARLLSSEKTYTMMANLRLKAGNPSGALQLLNEMRWQRMPMNGFSWETLLLCHVKELDLPSAQAVFQSMTDLGLANIVTYTNMINLYGTLGLEKDAEHLYRKVQREKLSPDAEFYGAMVKVYCMAKKLDAAEDVVRVMTEQGIVPNSVIRTTLACAYGDAGRINEAEACFRSSNADGAATLSMINMYDKLGEKTKASMLINSLTKNVSSLDASTLNFLVKRFAKAGQAPNGSHMSVVVGPFCGRI